MTLDDTPRQAQLREIAERLCVSRDEAKIAFEFGGAVLRRRLTKNADSEGAPSALQRVLLKHAESICAANGVMRETPREGGLRAKLKVASVAAIVSALIPISGCGAKPAEKVDVSEFFVAANQQRELANCLSDLGWDAKYDDDTGTITTTLAEEQNSQHEADSANCSEQIGIDFSEPLSNEDYTVIYEWYSFIGECLRKEGWAVPERPTFETFSSNYDSDPWLPWDEVPPEQIGKAGQLCPQLNQGQPR